MESDEKGGCTMIVAPDGKIINNLGKKTGHITEEIDPKQKYMRTAGCGGDMVRNDDFISAGLCPDAF
jgi:predicted amidohydrolase